MIVVLSGASGSGKTSACKIVAEAARAAQISAGGILCGAIFQDGRKVGIECSDLAASPALRPWPLAQIRPDWAGQTPFAATPPSMTPVKPAFDDSEARVLRYGMWEFSKLALVAADQAIVRYAAALELPGNQGKRIIFVDEIGPLELDRSAGLVQSLAILDGAASRHEADRMFLVVARPDIAGRLIERWPCSAMVEMDATGSVATANAILATLGSLRAWNG